MNSDVKALLDEYLVEVIETDNSIEIWRNGKMFKINKDYDETFYLDLKLQEFCVSSPISDKVGKKDFPQFFRTPEKGEFIAVKRFSNLEDYNYNRRMTISMYSMKKFKEFRDGKIVCEKKNGDEALYDFYHIIPDNKHPSTTFWFNGYQNRVLWDVIEKMFEEKS